MKQILLSAHIVILVLLLSACGGGSKTSSVPEGGDTLKMKYATNLSVVRFPDYTMVSIRNPWDILKILHTYLLTDKTQPVPENLPEGTVVRVPLERAVVYSVVHGSVLKELGQAKSIKGVCNLEYFKMPEVQDGCRNGEIVDCGNGMNPDIEKIIDLRPDAIMLSPFENSGGYGRVGLHGNFSVRACRMVALLRIAGRAGTAGRFTFCADRKRIPGSKRFGGTGNLPSYGIK